MLITLAVLGVPVSAVVVAFLWLSAGLEHRVEAAYRRRLPGVLTVGKIAFTSANEIVATDLTISESGKSPLIIVKRAVAHIRPIAGRLDDLRLEGVHMRLDAGGWKLINAILEAERAIPATRAANEQKITVADASLEVDGGLHLEQIAVDIVNFGAVLRFSATGKYAAEDLRLGYDTEQLDGGARRAVVSIERLRGRLPEILDGVVALGLLKPIPVWLRRYLPETVDGSGSRIVRDYHAHAWSGDCTATWPIDGANAGKSRMQAKLAADLHRITLEQLHWDDASVLIGDGRLNADLDQDTIAIDLDSWKPGPRLPIPAAVPVEALLQSLPTLAVRALTRTGSESITATLSGPTQSSVSLTWAHDQDLRVTATELPLTMAQPFLPKDLVMKGGQGEEVKLTIALGGDAKNTDKSGALRDFYLKARQARFSIRDWAFGPADGQCALLPTADGGFSLALSLPMGTIGYSGSAAAGTLTLDLKSAEALLARVRGPAPLPDIRGSLGAEVALTTAGEEISGTVKRLSLRGVGIPDLVQSVEADLKGVFTWKPLSLSARAGGQLRSGQLYFLDGWLDVAKRTPLFSADVVVTPSIGYAPAAFDVTEILVRAANPKGEPIEGAYSAQFTGNLTATGTGAIHGVIDHADLGWLATLVKGQDTKLSGEAAMVVSADFRLGVMKRVEGSFLPLNADLSLGRDFKATGITGAVQFLRESRVAPTTSEPK